MQMGFIHNQTMRVKQDLLQKSLEELEQQNLGDPATAPTNLVKRCIELSKVPINTFTLSDLRLMIGQQIGLSFLIPIAIEKLQVNIFVEADYYEGDLLSNVLSVDIKFWKDNQRYWTQLNHLISDKKLELTKREIEMTRFYSVMF